MSRRPSYLRVAGGQALAVVVIGLMQAATLVGIFLTIRTVVDALQPATVGQAAIAAHRTALENTAVLAALAVVYGVLRATEFSVCERAGYQVVRRLRIAMYSHLQGMRPDEVRYRARGGLLLRFIGDLSMLRMWVSRGVLSGTVSAIVLALTLGVVAWLDAWLALTVFGVLGFGAVLSLANGHRMRKSTRKMRRRRSLVTGNITEQVQALPVVQVFGRAKGELARLSRQNDLLTSVLIDVARLRGRLRGLSSGTGILAVAAVLAVGLIEVRNYHATVGTVMAAVVITRQLAGPVRTLGLAHDYWHRGQVSRTKIEDFLRSSSSGLEPADLGRLRVRRGRVVFDQVTVAGRLTDFSAEAPPGHIIAITGDNGAGKSSLLQVVARLADPVSGEVFIDGTPLSQTTPESTFAKIGLVAPDLPLMRGTVRRNLTYAAPRAPADEVQRVCFDLGLDRLLAELPDGLDTWLTERGENLSFGQRQLIALARAVLNRPPILLLDEPTLGLDAVGAAAVRRFLVRYHGTVLMVTHDPEAIAMADQVWLLDRGRLRSAATATSLVTGLARPVRPGVARPTEAVQP